MLEIKGKVNRAICYAKRVEEKAVEQIKRMCDYDLTRGSKIRIMPDVHAGKGCTIGTTMTISDRVCPNIVGVDIGCGMYTVKLEEKSLDFKKLDEVCHYIPSGMNVWESPGEIFPLTDLRCYELLKDKQRLLQALGTLGGGNHFIEVDKAFDGSLYLIIHSGSRNLGKQVAEIYQELAVRQCEGKEEYYKKRKEMIAACKESGRSCEIEKALQSLREEYEKGKETLPKELAYLQGDILKDYLHDVEICRQFAERNREQIAKVILEKCKIHSAEAFHTVHNYIDSKEMILRKGAIAAHKGERVLIPINMRDGSILAVGRGNEEWNCSAPHGAGRIMSRSQAKETINLKDYIEIMKGIYTSSVKETTLDEAPMAYKSLEDITDMIGELVDIIEVIRPVFNFKAS